MSSYIAAHAGGHFTAKEFRTWNATVLMALLLANAGAGAETRGSRKSVITASVRGVADWLGDTPAVARASYIDPKLISQYEADGRAAAASPQSPPRCPPPRKPRPRWPRCSSAAG